MIRTLYVFTLFFISLNFTCKSSYAYVEAKDNQGLEIIERTTKSLAILKQHDTSYGLIAQTEQLKKEERFSFLVNAIVLRCLMDVPLEEEEKFLFSKVYCVLLEPSSKTPPKILEVFAETILPKLQL